MKRMAELEKKREFSLKISLFTCIWNILSQFEKDAAGQQTRSLPESLTPALTARPIFVALRWNLHGKKIGFMLFIVFSLWVNYAKGLFPWPRLYTAAVLQVSSHKHVTSIWIPFTSIVDTMRKGKNGWPNIFVSVVVALLPEFPSVNETTEKIPPHSIIHISTRGLGLGIEIIILVYSLQLWDSL